MQWGVPLSNGAEKTDRGTPGSQTPIIVYRHKVAPLGNPRLASGLVIRARIKFETFSFFPLPLLENNREQSSSKDGTESRYRRSLLLARVRIVKNLYIECCVIVKKKKNHRYIEFPPFSRIQYIFDEREKEPLKAIELHSTDGLSRVTRRKNGIINRTRFGIIESSEGTFEITRLLNSSMEEEFLPFSERAIPAVDKYAIYIFHDYSLLANKNRDGNDAVGTKKRNTREFIDRNVYAKVYGI